MMPTPKLFSKKQLISALSALCPNLMNLGHVLNPQKVKSVLIERRLKNCIQPFDYT